MATAEVIPDEFVNQYQIFRPNDKDLDNKRVKKQQILEFMDSMREKKILKSDCFKNYKIEDCFFNNAKQKITYCWVYKCKEIATNEHKALKSILINLNNSGDLQFVKEIELLTSIDNPNIIKIEKVFFAVEKNIISVNLVMPWVNQTFASWLANSNNHEASIEGISNAKRSVLEVRQILIGILRGLACLHGKLLIHSDLTIPNILIEEIRNGDKSTFIPKICGFGVSQNLLALKQQFIGAPGYFAPEIIDFFTRIRNENEYDGFDVSASASQEVQDNNNKNLRDVFTPKADMYSLGVILYKLFISVTDSSVDINKVNKENVVKRIEQFFPKDKDTVSKEMIEDIVDIIHNLIEKDPKKRYHSLQLLLEHPFFK